MNSTNYIRQNVHKEISIWLDPKALLETEYGVITADEWLIKEQMRIPNTKIITDERDRTCLIRDLNEGETHG